MPITPRLLFHSRTGIARKSDGMCSGGIMRISVVASAIGLACVMSDASAREPNNEAVAGPDTAGVGLIVTGEKFRRSLKETPASVAIATSRVIDEQAMVSAYDVLDRTPNVAVDGSRTSFSIRGIDAFNVSGAGEGALASVYVDGAAIPRLALASGPLDLFDVTQVEILRGPQSTVQGRNALAGAVIINTADPTFNWSGKTRLLLSDKDGQRRLGMAIGGPISEGQVAFRLAGEASKTAGLIHNVTNQADGDPQRSRTLRGKLLLQPRILPGLRLISALLYDQHQRGTFYTELDPPYDPRARITTSDAQDRKRVTSAIGTVLVEYEVDAGSVLKSATSYSRIRFRSRSDANRTAVPGQLSHIDELNRAFQQEVRFHFRRSWVEGLVGAYYLRERRAYAYNALQSLSLASLGIGRQLQAAGLGPATVEAVLDLYGGTLPISNDLTRPGITDNHAAFADLTFPLGRQLRIRMGMRYDIETSSQRAMQHISIDHPLPNPDKLGVPALGPIVRRLNGLLLNLVQGANSAEPPRRVRYDAWLPKLGLSYDLASNMALSLTAQRGYRAGGSGFNAQRAESYDFEPEYSTTYEWALRSSWLGNRLSLNANLYCTDWRDQQVLVQLTPGALYDTRIINAGKSRLQGFEMESHGVISQTLTLHAGLGFGSARLKNFPQAEGNTLESTPGKAFPRAPRWTLSGAASFTHPNGWFANVNANYRTAYYQNVMDQRVRDIPSRTLVNAKLGWQGKHLGAFLMIANIFDVQKPNQFFVDVDGRRRGTLNAPRILGVSLEGRL
ncbi:TonB-dependent receptor-like protein [Sphingobium indicum UT26S]|uniref:TonB-dependent receptor-like protein n=2 Tax=Sphingomonadaceae TaxID=41297 RepID=D4Z4C8_SPHIU|nr:TonB-dependent receptor-like protein [Sphingobium indicum UT26S]